MLTQMYIASEHTAFHPFIPMAKDDVAFSPSIDWCGSCGGAYWNIWIFYQMPGTYMRFGRAGIPAHR